MGLLVQLLIKALPKIQKSILLIQNIIAVIL